MNERLAILKPCKRLVLKVGSAVLSGASGKQNQLQLARQIALLRQEGREVVLVSSGAVASGMAKLGLTERPKTMPQKQAAAAVGQPMLMQRWEQALAWFNLQVGQILLTAEDLANRHRYLNARHTLQALLQWGIVPIINENDSVMVDEIKFGDNDQLSALIAALVGADLLVIFSDIPALYTADPRSNPQAQAVPFVAQVTPEVRQMAGDSPNAVGTGGMRSKLLAAEKAQAAGIPMLLLPGQQPDSLLHALQGQEVGTLFAASERRYAGQKLWLSQLPQSAGALLLDAGAAKALRNSGASLLPAGIKAVQGVFDVGEAVRVLDPSGAVVGVGLVNYASAEIERIKGAQTQQIEGILGYKHSDEVIHRDHFALGLG